MPRVNCLSTDVVHTNFRIKRSTIDFPILMVSIIQLNVQIFIDTHTSYAFVSASGVCLLLVGPDVALASY